MVQSLLAEASECESCCSSEASEQSLGQIDSDSPIELAGLEPGGEDDQVQMAQKARGSNAVRSNGYFTFMDNKLCPDIEVVVVPRWRRPRLWHNGDSKTLVPAHYGDSRNAPERTMLCLRAWMLFEASKNGFCDGRASRRQLFARETTSLREDILARSSAARPSTGNTAADNFIRAHAPAIPGPGEMS